MKNLFLYNNYHNGDLFYSRIFLKLISEKYDKIFYFHNNKHDLFHDIMNVNEMPIDKINSFCDIKIDTWIGQENYKFLRNGASCSYENHLYLAKYLAHNIGIDNSIYEEVDCLPFINFENLKNKELAKKNMELLKNYFEKIIFISNGDVHSGQSSNFDFSNIIAMLAAHYKHILFLTTQETHIQMRNIITASKITKIIPDLLQLGYVSTFCDVIVGRASGPYCFTHIKENFSNDKKIFISFTNTKDEGVFYKKQKSKFIWSNNYNLTNIKNIIESSL